MFDTIAAISTPRGEGGIGIVRMSGDDSLKILAKIFKPKNTKKVEELNNFSINYGFIYDESELVDEVMVSILKGPKTYTKEDIVEINCHGGYLLTGKVLELVLKKGAKLAERGEFTRRAFLNGRIDLTQAEATIDLIHGKTETALTLSLNQLRGDLQAKIADLKKSILDVSAHVNVVLDYPEEGIDNPLPDNLLEDLNVVKVESKKLIDSYDRGKMIKEGVKTAILGRPNVGKSSLLNALLKENRAIVTHIPGTTRDIIEEVININGLPLVLVDTAGIRETDDLVENIGVEKSKQILTEADLILFVVDGNEGLIEADNELLEEILKNSKENQKNIIGILNKIDLGSTQKSEKILEKKELEWVKISAKEEEGIDKLEDIIYQKLVKNNIQDSSKGLVLTNIRHKSALEQVIESVDNVLNTLNIGLPMDLIAIDLREALDALGEITGEISSEDLLDHVFSNFCVGK